MSDLPLYDKLRMHRETCLLGLAAAEQCGAMDRAAHYRACLDEVARRMAALVTAAYPEQSREDWRRLVLARRRGHITAREFGQYGWWVRHARAD